MLERIGTKDKVPAFVEGVKNRKEKMFGFGHRCACTKQRKHPAACTHAAALVPSLSFGPACAITFAMDGWSLQWH